MAQLRSLSRPARAAPTRPAESSEDELLSSAADVAPTAKNAPSASHDRSSASPPPRGAPAGAAASAPSSRPAVTATRASARFVVADDSDSELSELSDRHDHLSDLDFEDAPEGVEEEESQEDEEEEEEDTEVLEDSSRRERGDGRRGRRKLNIDVKTDRAVGRRAASAAAASTDDRFQYVEEGQEPTDVVVSITPPSQAQREEFEVLPENDTVQSVWHEIRHSRRGGSRYLVGFVDGRVKEVRWHFVRFSCGGFHLSDSSALHSMRVAHRLYFLSVHAFLRASQPLPEAFTSCQRT